MNHSFMTTFYSRVPRKVRLFIVFLLIILVAYFAFQFSQVEPRNIPEDFLKAREDASVVAGDIVAISRESADRLHEIAQLDRDGKYAEALSLVTRELEQNRLAREKALQLSSHLETMAKNLYSITPASASQVALQAISSETMLISRLISYNDYMIQLLMALREKFAGRSDGHNIPALVERINEEARVINSLDEKFNSLMADF